jgi:hypothetical protein
MSNALPTLMHATEPRQYRMCRCKQCGARATVHTDQRLLHTSWGSNKGVVLRDVTAPSGADLERFVVQRDGAAGRNERVHAGCRGCNDWRRHHRGRNKWWRWWGDHSGLERSQELTPNGYAHSSAAVVAWARNKRPVVARDDVTVPAGERVELRVQKPDVLAKRLGQATRQCGPHGCNG